MVRVIGPRDPREKDAINTTSTSKTWSRGLSPFLIGPVTIYDTYEAKVMENAWQYSKVYPCHTDGNGNYNEEYFLWATEGFRNPRGVRYPMGKGAIPLYSLGPNGQRLSYIEARKALYIPWYIQAVRNTEAYKRLAKEYAEKGDITLWDFDGYDHKKLGMSLEDVVNNRERPMGHAFVLAMLLELKLW